MTEISEPCCRAWAYKKQCSTGTGSFDGGRNNPLAQRHGSQLAWSEANNLRS